MRELFIKCGKHEYGLGVVLDSGDDERPCTLTLYAFKYFIKFMLPRIVWPVRIKRDYVRANGSVATYYDVFNRVFGFVVYEEHVHMYYGARTYASLTEKVKLFCIPWRMTRRVRYDFYTADHEYFGSVNDYEGFLTEYEAIKDAERKVPKLKIQFNDFDGEKIVASCYIEEMEWRNGVGLFKWVGSITKPTIVRSMVYEFDKEAGRTKTDWTGGIISASRKIEKGDSVFGVFTSILKNSKMFNIESPNCKIID